MTIVVSHKDISSSVVVQTLASVSSIRPYLGICPFFCVQGHTAKQCSYPKEIPMSSHQRPTPGPSAYSTPCANIATHPSPYAFEWIIDTGASHHIIANIGNLSLHYSYSGHDIDSLTLPASSNSLTLDNVLCVPAIKNNLIYISQLCSTNNIYVTLFPNAFQARDLHTRAKVHQGPVNDGVYMQSTSLHSYSCNSCKSNKSPKLPFYDSTLILRAPLDIIFSDVWTCPTHFNDAFHYFVIFVDHFSCYIWFYPRKRKSEVQYTFIRFKKIVKKTLIAQLYNVLKS